MAKEQAGSERAKRDRAYLTENQGKTLVKELLDRYGVFHWPASASPYGVGGVPDRLAILPRTGRLLGVEVKTPGKKATALQAAFGERMKRSGAAWFLVDSKDALAELERFLEEEL